MPGPRVKPIFSVLFAAGESIPRCQEILEEAFGSIEAISEPFLFLFSDYYRKEMGPDLQKVLFAVESLMESDGIVPLKKLSMQIEEKHRDLETGGRRFNIDPGFLSLNQFVLTSRKEAAHRIYLASEIFAEVALIYSRGKYRPLDWTYPDFRLDRVSGFLRKVRGRYLRQLKFPPGSEVL